MPVAVPRLVASGSVAPIENLRLAIGLPLRNQDALTNLLEQLYDPSDAHFHQWISSDEFTKQFGPTEDDYAKVVRFAQDHGLTITHQHANRLLLDVTAPSGTIEQAFKVKMRVYPHPTEKRNFYAPDREPSIPSDVPIFHVSGMDNFSVPHPLYVTAHDQSGVTPYLNGSGPSGTYTGNDFRKAYVPGVTNTGSGQYIAVIDVGGAYYTNDVYMYMTNAGLPLTIVYTNILLDGSTGVPNGNNVDDGEEALDIDMAMSMAPGATILNYEGGADDVFNQIAIDNKAKQMTLSYGFGLDANNYQAFMEFAAQGQSMSQASGDGGADLSGGTGLTGNPYATIVGGTGLNIVPGTGAWQSETAWSGSGGGISGYGIPNWQLGVASSTNLASPVYRNYPDVAMLGQPETFIYVDNGSPLVGIGGTSESSPLWAGFMALVNQQAATLGKPPVGFINPAIYRLGLGLRAAYNNSFHDITVGNNFNSQNPTSYPATNGYDLCTGWGTPTGINTINALVGVGTNDFEVFAMPAIFNVLRGSVTTTTISVALMNGLTGKVNFSVSALPPGVSASFTSTSTSTNTILALTVSNIAALGTNTAILTATSGSLTHTLNLNFNVTVPIPGETAVSLSPYFNRAGIYMDGASFGGGLDNGGSAYSASLLGTSPGWNGANFTLGPINANDAISAAGQTITLPAGNFSSLLLLGTGVDGSQGSQTFTVTYTDGSTTNFSQNLSDWVFPQGYADENIVLGMAYRLSNNGSKQLNTGANLYGYSFTLDQTKTVKSITLPNNGNVIILAMTLANDTAFVSLAPYYNHVGLYSDGTTYTNPSTGGLDGGGYSYSASLLGGSLVWTNTIFNFAPANGTNVIAAAGQTIPLPPGNFYALRMLASGIQGNQAGQSFTLTYANNDTSTFTQSFSDWFTPQNYPGETKAVITGHRNYQDGTKDNRTFYLYGYTFLLNSTQTVQSLQLPTDSDLIIVAMSLAPYLPAVYASNPLLEPSVQAGQSFSTSIAGSAVDLNGSSLGFAKVSGASWLRVFGNGRLIGTPLTPNVGTNSFVISATDTSGESTNTTVLINVTPPPTLISAITNQNGSVVLSWSGGIPPYQVQMSTNLTSSSSWSNLGGTVGTTSLTIAPTNAATFYRIEGQ